MVSICYCGRQAGYGHEEWCPRPLYQAGARDEEAWITEANERKAAYSAGCEHGRAAASWYFDGNTPDATYRAVLAGIEDGDPAVLDTFPYAPLSGEFADDPTPASVLADLGSSPDAENADDLLTLYESGFYAASHEAIESAARERVKGSVV